jgi:hypothetical protein
LQGAFPFDRARLSDGRSPVLEMVKISLGKAVKKACDIRRLQQCNICFY